MTEPRQEDLAEACRHGDERAFAELYRLHGKGMVHVVQRILGNAEDAADVVQEAFLTAFRRFHTYRGEGSLRGWLYRIAVRLAFRARRRRRPAVSLDEPDAPALAAPRHHASDREFLQAVEREIQRLPERARIVFTLRTVEELTHAEIARVLDIHEGTSKSQLNYARGLLRKRLARWNRDM